MASVNTFGHCIGCLKSKHLLTDVEADVDVSHDHALYEVRHPTKLRIVGSGMIPGVGKDVAIDENDPRRLTVNCS